VLHVPTGSRLRSDAPLNQIKLAVGLALIAQMTDRSTWIDLALRTDTEDLVRGHGRLLRSLAWNDDDYDACVQDVVPEILGLREVGPDRSFGSARPWGSEGDEDRRDVYLDHLPLLEEYLDLPGWLAEHEPRLHRVLYAAAAAEAAALEAVTEMTAGRDLPEIVRQLDRLNRDLGDDLPAALGHAKDLVESACKTILGEHGPGAGAMKFPALVAAALKATGRHPSQIDPADPDAELLRRLLGALNTQLDAISGLRNRAGSGHGRAGDVPLDASLARLVIGQALTAAAYLLHAADLHAEAGDAP
jgi:hypothetical protein